MSAKATLGMRLLRMPPVLLIVLVWLTLASLDMAVASLSTTYVAQRTEIALTACCGLLLSLMLYALTRKLARSSSRFALPLITLFALICGCTLWTANVLFQFWIGGHGTVGHLKPFAVPGDYFLRLRYNCVYFTTLFVLQAFIFALINFSRLLETRERQLLDARLTALRFQLNPHFLFNTLNAIDTLIAEANVAEAGEMLKRLSAFLRTSLSEEPTGLVSLSRELDTVQAYLDIEAVRFGDRLVIHYACASGLAEVPVPSLILQPLVENAIKYAVAPSKAQVTVSIEASADDKHLILAVADDGKQAPVANGAGTGVGLRNVAARLEALYGSAARIEASRRELGFAAVIRLPLRRDNRR